ncbi:ABC transporter ATP-binding protein [Lactovum odontotermitis]
MSEIIIKDAVKRYGKNTVIPDLSLSIKDGSLFTLLGPSGCGKTTLLRMIAGFNSIEGGDFYFNETRINDLDPSKRNIGMVFQNYAIFPHLTVEDNVKFGLKQRKLSKQEIQARTDEYLKLMQIEEYRDRKPENLSGGQQQRVALARAIAINPDVLLMDEPLSNLDAKLRLEMRQAIRDIQHQIGITTVYVTHDQEEAMAISDQIAVMNKGEIQQIGSPKELYHRPKNEFVATFIGRTNMIDAELVTRDGQSKYVIAGGIEIVSNKPVAAADQPVRLSVRPEDLEVVGSDTPNAFPARIEYSVYLGMNTEYIMSIGLDLKVQVNEESTFEQNLEKGDTVYLRVNVDKINIFTADGAVNLLSENEGGQS